MLPKYIKDKFSELEHEIYKELVEVSKANPNRGIESTVQRLQEQRDSLVKTFVPNIADTEDRITSEALNEFYTGILADLHRMFGVGSEIDMTLYSYTKFSESNLKRLQGSLRNHEHRLKKLQFLRDNRQYAEAKSVDLIDNRNPEKPAVFNSLENSVTLSTTNSKIIKEADIEVKIIGASEVQSLPDYSPEMMFDQSQLSSWYTIAGYTEKPSFYIDPTRDGVKADLLGYTEFSTLYSMDIGTNKISGTSLSASPNKYVTIGEPQYLNSESIQILSSKEDHLVTRNPLAKKHFPGEPIYLGRDLQSVKGALAVVDFKFKIPVELDMLRLNPFSSKPMKVHGLYVPANPSDPEDWELIEGTSKGVVDKYETFSFDRVITTHLRLLVEQTFGELVVEEVSSSEQTDEAAWEVIWSKEQNERSSFLNAQLENYDKRAVERASEGEFEGFLLRQNFLESLQKQEYGKETTETASVEQAELSISDRFYGVSDTDTRQVKRWVYDIGLTEVEFFMNSYDAFSYFESSDLGFKKNASSFSVIADEERTPATTIHHALILDTGDEVPLVNQNNRNRNGEVISFDELLDIDPDTRTAILRFQPGETTVEITRWVPDVQSGKYVREPTATPATVGVGRVVTLDRAYYDINAAYTANYAVEDPDSFIEGNIPSQEVLFLEHSTNEEGFIVLPNAPFIETGVVNDRTLFRRPDSLNARYLYNVGKASTVSSTTVLPTGSVIVDNTYYGPAGAQPLIRSSSLETDVLTILEAYSGDSQIRMNQFFNRYHGKNLPENLEYEPIRVTVDGEKAINLSQYDGNPHSGFVSSIPGHLQFRHTSNRLLFAEPFEDKSVEISYKAKSSSYRYKATLRTARKSNFWTTPKLKNVLVSSI